MKIVGNNTYYFNSKEGVIPADHAVKYDYDKAVSDTFYGDYDMAEARLEIENPKSLDEYLENIEGHYIEGVSNWQEAHKYLIDLVQAMLVELVKTTPSFNNVREYSAVINESYADGSFVDYSVSYWPENEEINIYLEASNNLKGIALSRSELDKMLMIEAVDLE
jgi:hypothetical protein